MSKKAFEKRFGTQITAKLRGNKDDRVVRFLQPDLTRKPMAFLGKTDFNDPLNAVVWRISTINPLGLVCSSCSSTVNIEMHHIRHVKTINSKLTSFEKMMAKINRKQVPLCRDCHIKVHKGEYNGLSVKNFSKVFCARYPIE